MELLTYSQLMEKLRPLFEKDEKRFMRFYDSVFLIIRSIPEGGTIQIKDHCSQRAFDLFRDVASLCIIEEMIHDDGNGGVAEFTDDYLGIHRSVSCRPPVRKIHFYSFKNGMW